MRVVLDPIVAPETFEQELEAEIAAWFEEAIFRPLFDAFDEERPNAWNPSQLRNKLGEWSSEGSGPASPTPEQIRETKVARIKELIPQINKLAGGGGLTRAEAAKFVDMNMEVASLRFEIQKPLPIEKIPSEAERKSTLPASVVFVARADLMRSRAVYMPTVEAAIGVFHSSDTPLDKIIEGRDPALSADAYYHAFDDTRNALRGAFGPTMKLYRAIGQQIDKPTTNWATTREYAAQFGKQVIEREISVDKIAAVNVGPFGKYHEIIVLAKEPEAYKIAKDAPRPNAGAYDPNQLRDKRGKWSKSGSVNWDVKGIGSIPYQVDIDYYGFTRNLTPEQFLDLVPPGVSGPTTKDFISEEIKKGTPIAPPYLRVKWDKARKAWQIMDHEGRSRSRAAPSGRPMPVSIKPEDFRARDLTPEVKAAPLIAQEWSYGIHGAETDNERENDFDPAEPRDETGKWTTGGVHYHGTNEDFKEFDEAKIGKNDEGWLGRGFYFSSDKNVAAHYRFQKKIKLSVSNPLKIELPDFKTDKRRLVRETLGLPKDASASAVTEAAKARGFDAIVLDYAKTGYKHRETVVFDKSKIEEVEGDRENAGPLFGALIDAVRSGRISYANGVFSGKFSAEISRQLRSIGAKFDKEEKTYRVAPKEIPLSLRGVLSDAKSRSEALHLAIEKRTVEIAANVASSPSLGLRLEAFTRKLLKNLDAQFRESIEIAATEQKAIEFVATPPDFTEGTVADVREMLTENLTLSIKDFTEEETLKIRELAEENWVAGGRVNRLKEIIEERFGVSERKARFLARQETSMIASEFARARAQEIGSTEYVWFTRHDDRVRPEHQARNGKTFQWDDPPYDSDIHEHVNPGMAYGCRCAARAVLNVSAARVYTPQARRVA